MDLYLVNYKKKNKNKIQIAKQITHTNERIEICATQYKYAVN